MFTDLFRVSEAKKFGIGFGKCMKNKWVKKDGDTWKSAVSIDSYYFV